MSKEPLPISVVDRQLKAFSQPFTASWRPELIAPPPTYNNGRLAFRMSSSCLVNDLGLGGSCQLIALRNHAALVRRLNRQRLRDPHPWGHRSESDRGGRGWRSETPQQQSTDLGWIAQPPRNASTIGRVNAERMSVSWKAIGVPIEARLTCR